MVTFTDAVKTIKTKNVVGIIVLCAIFLNVFINFLLQMLELFVTIYELRKNMIVQKAMKRICCKKPLIDKGINTSYLRKNEESSLEKNATIFVEKDALDFPLDCPPSTRCHT